MKRRDVLTAGAAGAALAASRVLAQPKVRQFRIGVLSPLAALGAGPYLSVLRDQLAKHGFIEGRNLTVDVRAAENALPYAKEMGAEIVALKPDAIIAFTTFMAAGAMAATNSVPIVFAWVADPVRSKLVKDLAKPGANVTGVTNRFFELAAKRIELVRELLPSAKRVAVIAGVFDPMVEIAMQFATGAAERLGLELVRVQGGRGWEQVMHISIERGAHAALVMTPFAIFGAQGIAEHVVRGAIDYRLPAIYSDVETVELGGLMSYATNLTNDVRRGADLLARVLKGEKPADLPVDQASRFELAINLKTARAIGLTMPHSMLVRADRVID